MPPGVVGPAEDGVHEAAGVGRHVEVVGLLPVVGAVLALQGTIQSDLREVGHQMHWSSAAVLCGPPPPSRTGGARSARMSGPQSDKWHGSIGI